MMDTDVDIVDLVNRDDYRSEALQATLHLECTADIEDAHGGGHLSHH